MRLACICRTVLALGWVIGLRAGAEPLRVRLGTGSGATMIVNGIDDAGRIRLTPEAGGEGEALLPLEDARDLRFLLPPDYLRAQQLMFASRDGEAVRLLSRIVPGLAPYAGVPGSNAGAAVRLYLQLLIREKKWPEALALADGLPVGEDAADFAATRVELARALQSAGRADDVVWLLGKVPVSRHGDAIGALADDLRREGRWDAAHALYERLRPATADLSQARFDLLLAYTDWQRGSGLRTGVVLQLQTAPPADEDAGTLYRLLQGRQRLAGGDARGALDVLAEALVSASPASEWRVEIAAVLAEAYRAVGQNDVAEHIVIDLRRLYPGSRWIPPAPPTAK